MKNIFLNYRTQRKIFLYSQTSKLSHTEQYISYSQTSQLNSSQL